jgi:hypothetical protein
VAVRLGSMPGPEMLCVYQFKVVLRGISPMIWRRLLLRSGHSIADLPGPNLTGAPSINGSNNMLVVRGNGSFVTASGDEIPHPPRRGIRSWPTRAGDRLFGAQMSIDWRRSV